MAAPRPETAASPRRLGGSFALVDLETTGGSAAWHRVIEVGIVLYEHGHIVEEWSALVNPGMRIPAGIETFTGITNAMVADAPRFAAIAAEIQRRLDGRIFVAHNARFDHGFLRSEFRRLGGRLSVPVVCTVKLSRSLYPQHASHSLDALIERHGLGCTARHRALGDARVLAEFLDRAVAQHGTATVEAAISRMTRRPALPPQLPPDLVDDLPDGPGVYLFHGADNVPLYIGKSTNIRSRVLQHFAAGHRSSAEQALARLVTRIDWQETPGELGALLREARLVKEMKPTHNRRLRGSDVLWTIRLDSRDVTLQPRVEQLDAGPLATACGMYRSRREAAQALERRVRGDELCLKVVGLERGAGSCFAFQLGRCRGACVGREPQALHDTRLRLAFEPQRLREWPFAGPIGVRERSLVGEEIHVFDAWRHLGSARSDDEIETIRRESGEVPFDPDVYRILARVLAKRIGAVLDLTRR